MISFIKKLFSKKIEQAELKSVGTTSETNSLIEIDSTPDRPIPFGYKCHWFAIHTNDTERVIELFDLHDDQESNWKSGIKSAYEGFVFISPPVLGWTLVISNEFPDASNEKFDNILEVLAKNFQSIRYFGTHRVVEYQAWDKIENGRLVRKFAYLGESGEVICNEGIVTEEEKALGFRFEDIEHDEFEHIWVPNEENVMSIAGSWSINPALNYRDIEEGLGVVGKLNLNVFQR